MRPLLWPTRHMLSEGGCTLRTGRHLLIIVSLMLASISVTVRESGEDTGTVSTLSTEWEGLDLHAGMHDMVYAKDETSELDSRARHCSRPSKPSHGQCVCSGIRGYCRITHIPGV